MSSEEKGKSMAVEVTADDLPLYCPQPDQPLWSRHPRVYLEVCKTGVAYCPYCSTRYTLAGGPVKAGH